MDTNFVNLPGSTPCRAYDVALFNPGSIGEILLAWHTHPFKPAHYVVGVGWVTDTGELLPYPGCAPGPGVGVFPGPSGLKTGEGDVNQPWPQIIVDKTNVYWIEHPPTDPSQVTNTQYETKRRQQCDVLAYF